MTPRIVLLATVALLATRSALPLSAQQSQRPMDVADIFRLHSLQAAELSPDGAWVVYEAQRLAFPDWKRVTDLFLVSADGRTRPNSGSRSPRCT